MKRFVLLAAVVALMASLFPASALAAGEHSFTHGTVTSKADGTTKIAITVFKPAGASDANQVPVILHSHGWGGSRTKTISAEMQALLDAGFGVVSFDQRGFGDSDGEANVQDPDLETKDVQSIIDYIAELDWVKHDVDALGAPIANDPVLGAIGGSYGGGYQTMTALDEIAANGSTRFNALAPEITWFDLNESLAPQGVVRTAWATALFAAGATALPQYVQTAFAWGAATGLWPDGTVLGQANPAVPNLAAEFASHAPVYFTEQGKKIDIPVLYRQGISDNLFNLNQGLKIFREALTPAAQARSLFVGYNGGHVLPNAFPVGTGVGADACSKVEGGPQSWGELRVRFFTAAFAGQPTGNLLPARYNLTDVAGVKCHRFGDFATTRDVMINEGVDPTGSNGMVSTTGAGAPIHLEVASGPITVAGIPTLEGEVYSGPEARVFFGLAIGTTPADAQVIQNNVMPLRKVLPAFGEAFKIELPAIAAEVPEGKKLFLTISPFSDMFFGHGSRVPSGMVLTGLKLTIPTL